MNSHTFNTMKKAKDKVIFLLESIPHLRQSDEKLIATFWWYELGKDKTTTISAFAFLDLYSKKKITNAETIRRCRAKVQEQYPHLRGDNWDARKAEGNEFNNEVHDL
jgi:hypothetical protein